MRQWRIMCIFWEKRPYFLISNRNCFVQKGVLLSRTEVCDLTNGLEMIKKTQSMASTLTNVCSKLIFRNKNYR